jgi:hypothetical protein
VHDAREGGEAGVGGVAITLDTYSHVLPAADVSVAHTLAGD